jgi:hypothetical protein
MEWLEIEFQRPDELPELPELNEWGDTKLIEKFRPRLEILVNKT